jgi:hypothetical protein
MPDHSARIDTGKTKTTVSAIHLLQIDTSTMAGHNADIT